MPAYNAAKTLRQTYDEVMAQGMVDQVIVVDDASHDETADIVIMVQPDYQYTPKLIPAMATIIANDLHPCVLGSRILGGYALKGGMPLWRYVSNRFLTLVENLALGAKLSEYHTGYRAFSRTLLERLPLAWNSADFVFDHQILAPLLCLVS